MPWSRILLATDFSESAREAARLAARLGSERTHHRVVHVVPAPLFLRPGALVASESIPRHHAETLLRMEAWCEAAGLRGAEASVLLGGVGREVAREATRSGADLVIVGHRGQSALKQILLGSVARSVLREAPVDTLVARGPVPDAPAPAFRRILVATDFQPPGVRAAARALQLAKEHNADLEIVHVVDPSVWYDALHDAPSGPPGRARVEAAVSDQLQAFGRDHLQGQAACVILHGRPAHEIARHAAEHGHDLLVISSHGAGALERAMLGSTAESIVERAPCSVLIVR